jgi:hypothetical protein
MIFQNVGIGLRHHYKVVGIGGRPFIEQLIVVHSKGQSKKDNPEKLTTQSTQDEVKHNTICVGH